MMIELKACEKTEKDAARAFAWRNDPETVAASYVARPKTWDSFWLEFSEYYFRIPDFSPLFVLSDGRDAGFVRFDAPDRDYGKAAELMINIAPEFRGKGVGTATVEAVKMLFKARGYERLIADVRRQNESSLKMFAKTGFREESVRTERIERTGEICSIVRLVCLL